MKKTFSSKDYFYILRLLRLYANGVFRSIDKNFHPEITILIFTVGGHHDYFKLSAIPNYSKHDIQMNEELNLEEFFKNNVDFEKEIVHGDNFKNQILENLKQRDSNRKYYLSDFIFLSDSVYTVVTDFDKKVIDVHKKLKKHTASFVESLIKEYIKDLSRFLVQYSTSDLSKPVSYARTIQFAGEWFTTVLGCSIKDTIYRKLNVISSLNYEGEEGKGKILFTDTEYLIGKKVHPDIEFKIKFGLKVPISLYRAIRKLLELAKGDYYLLSDTKYIYGLGTLNSNYDKKQENIFVVKFLKHYTWELRHGNDRLMLVSHENPSLSRERLPLSVFAHDLEKTFGELEEIAIHRLYDIVHAATMQKKGTLVVISDHAREEAQRLKNQCLIIEPTLITQEIVGALSSIDGAILVDENAKGHAIGVILDGYASTHGTVTRGARYNSSIRYVETMAIKSKDAHKCIAIVVSEDGMINIISKSFFSKRDR